MTTALKRFTAAILRRRRPWREGASVGGAVGADEDAAHVLGGRLVGVGDGRLRDRTADAVARVGAELVLRPATDRRGAERDREAQDHRQRRPEAKARVHTVMIGGGRDGVKQGRILTLREGPD